MSAWAMETAGCVFGIGALLFLIGSCIKGTIRELAKWRKTEMGSARKRLNVTIGQPLEIEYSFTSQKDGSPARLELSKVFAYSGAVRVQITNLLRESRSSALWHSLEDLCWKAEGLEAPIPR